ncbi:uncharacterized protein LOC125497657 [Beta vulgaris subsp. vulgaris]|uniref:uncharacterized protein LOC125497657 n=1 Tax=Beta vulgaris subsp. vulgaris TaxID=3555 RepID=UPI002036D7CB|nr:uncharacterized protein LOC125497657 [Beta vulgaris subsp. vulgaris]
MEEWNHCDESNSSPEPRSFCKPLGHNAIVRRCAVWVPPPEGVFKVNFDGSKYSDGRASFGFVIRNYLGDAILAGCNSLPSDCSIVQAEAFGLWEAIKAAQFCNLPWIIIEGDNLSVINAFLKSWKPPWVINSLLQDVWCDLGKFNSVSISHCFREANRVADFMAHQGHAAQNLCYKFPPFSVDFSLVIRKDVLGCPPD